MNDLDTVSVLGLGLGPVSYDRIEQLVNDGKVIVSDAGNGKLKVQWADGYNASNYNSNPTRLQYGQSGLEIAPWLR